MKTKTQLNRIVALLFVLCNLFSTWANAQSCTLEQKYWAYRKNLNDKFVKVDWASVADGYDDTDGIGVPLKNPDGSYVMPIRFTKSGFSTPVEGYNAFANFVVPGGDNTIRLGNYISMLATEYKLLKNAGDVDGAKKTLDELFLAQQALRRLDMSANLFFQEAGKVQADLDKIPYPIISETGDTTGWETTNGPCVDSVARKNNIRLDGYSGFFYRDDFTWNTSLGNASQANETGDYKNFEIDYTKKGKFDPKGVHNFTSEDQIYGLLFGMVMAKKMVTPATTPEEQKVLDNANKSIVGLIAQGLGVIDLLGCFEDQGSVVGNGNQRMRKNQLIYIAQSLGLFNEVLKIAPGLTTLWSTAPDIKILEAINNSGCVPGNNFQINHYMRLHSICPMPMGAVPSINSITNNNLLVGAGELVAYANYSDKPSFALASVIMNSDKLSSGLLSISQCDKMKAILDKAPCCGPCINCTSNPKSDFETACSNISIVSAAFSLNAKKLKCYRVPKDPSKTTWFTPNINEDGGQCGKRTSSWEKEYPMFYNGIDFMQDFNYWMLACNNGDEDHKPKLTRPANLSIIEGCENEGQLHIAGPEEVCPGEKVNFTIPMETLHLPVTNARWRLGNTVVKSATDPLNGNTLTQYMKLINITSPNQAGTTQTVSYTFDMAGTTRTISKQFTVIDVPKSPVITDAYSDPSKCTFNINLQNQPNTVAFSASDGTYSSTNTMTFDMFSEPYEVTIYAINKCGKSIGTTYTIPKASEKCKYMQRVVKTGIDNIDPIDIAILCNPSTKTIRVKSEILYNAPFDCRLYDMTGRLVHNQHFETIDISIDYSGKELESGIYIFSLSSGETFIKSSKFYLENY